MKANSLSSFFIYLFLNAFPFKQIQTILYKVKRNKKHDNRCQSIFTIMSRQIQHSEINNLINSNEIKLDCARVGCCNRYYLTFPNDNHKYYYNSNKSISIILQNKISKHLYTMSSTRLNKKQLYHKIMWILS